MDADPSPVIVTTGATARATQVHHRDFPEVRAQGETPEVAASHLANQLVRALDSAPPWRRQRIEQALADVRAFATQHSAT
ncbi:MAG TPA: hypothetical protein VF590_07910 [Isosphaeraceae bacterium]